MQLTETAARQEADRQLEKLSGQLFASVPEAAVILRVDRRTLYRALEAGDVPGFKVGVFWKIPVVWLREVARVGGDSDAA